MFLFKSLIVPAFALCVGLVEAQAPADLPALTLLLEKFHSAYRMKDGSEILALWSEQSPQRAEQRDKLQKLLAGNAASEIRQVSVGEPEITGDRARVRIDREFIPVPGPGLYQINVVIPTGAMNGDNSISVSYGGSSIPDGALITVTT